ncbi:MAG: hypothetical protein JSS81_01515 [Acidobacteria bacterium]|nr:hypothetical protein [Acidobacteriota bacterium]
MKLKVIPVIAALFVFVSFAFGQTVTITPKKTVYTRKGKVSLREKRTFTVVYPIVGGGLAPAVKQKLEKTISYWEVFGTSLKEYLGGDDWLNDAYFKVNYNRGGLLDITLTEEGTAAYPDAQTKTLVVDLKSGEAVKFADVFDQSKAGEFARLVDRKLKTEAAAIVKRIDKGEFGDNGKEADDALKEQLTGLEFTADSFDEFSISDKGVTILYDAGFPHVVEAAEPAGRYFFAWAELKAFVRTDGLFGRFVK